MNKTSLLIVGVLSTAAGLAACAATETGFSDGPECATTTTEIATDELSPIGFSVAELVQQVAGTHAALLTWERSGTGSTEVTVTVELDTSQPAVYQLTELAEGDEGPADACHEEQLGVPVIVTLHTADGAFAESWSEVAIATRVDRLNVGTSLPIADLGGSFVDEGLVGVALSTEIRSNGDGFGSTLVGQIEGTQEAEAGVPSAMVSVARWSGND